MILIEINNRIVEETLTNKIRNVKEGWVPLSYRHCFRKVDFCRVFSLPHFQFSFISPVINLLKNCMNIFVYREKKKEVKHIYLQGFP